MNVLTCFLALIFAACVGAGVRASSSEGEFPVRAPGEEKRHGEGAAQPEPIGHVVGPDVIFDPGDTDYALSTKPLPQRAAKEAALFPSEGGPGEQPTILAVPANNACSAATPISGTGVFPFDTTMATTDGLAHLACTSLGQSQINRDVWYRWTAPATAGFVIETCLGGAGLDTKIAVYNNVACPPFDNNLLGCNDDACSTQSRVTFNAVQGTQYIFRIGVFPGAAGGVGTFSVSFQSGQALCTQPAQNCQARNLADAYQATGVSVMDDFTPDTSGSISTLCFWGTYFDGLNDCQLSATDRFTIRYWTSFGGVPDILLRQFTPGQYTLVGPVRTGEQFAGAFDEYQYLLTHAPVNVSSNACYWIEIVNDLQGGGCTWYWAKGDGANNYALFDEMGAGTDLAFCFNRELDPSTECNVSSAPSNDACAGAQTIFCNNSAQVPTTFATVSTGDPVFTCRFGGAGQGVGTLWYRFRPSATTARLSLCQSIETGDTLMAVYSGSNCGTLTQIACNDDLCGLRSQMCLTGLNTSLFYYVQISPRSDVSRGTYDIVVNCPCPPAPTNDTCAGATLLTLNQNGFAGAGGSTVNAGIDATIPTCDFSTLSAPSVWYRIVGNGRLLRASLCESSFDTKVNVYCGDCSSLACVGSNDDFPGCPPNGLVEWCAELGRTYYILVHGFNGAVGTFNLTVTVASPDPCSGAANCESCNYPCPSGALAENEPCGGADNNGGCNVLPNVFQNIQCGQTVCGTAYTRDNLVRDTDWYQFTLTSASRVTWSAQSEGPLELFLINDQCFPGLQVLASGPTERCGTATCTAVLEAGTYRAFAAQIEDAYFCGSGGNDYVATLECVPLGACCTGQDCRRTSQSECGSGTWGGPGTSCRINYVQSSCSNAFEDIASTGTALEIAGDGGASIPIGFLFRFYGVDHSTVGVSANGYLSFGPDLSALLNTSFPNTASPNAIIAPFWDDLAPENGGQVDYTVLGIPPTRRLIVQWTSVPRFLQVTPNTFQAVLFEGTNCVEFRYGSIDPASSPSVGVENHDGRRGTTSPGLPTSGQCRRFCPTLETIGCAAGCLGDADLNGVVNFNDITFVLASWGGPGPIGDADLNGVVNFNDVTIALASLGSICDGFAP